MDGMVFSLVDSSRTIRPGIIFYISENPSVIERFVDKTQFDTDVESARALEKKKKMMMVMMMMKRIVRSTPLGSSRAGCRSYQRIYLPFPSVAHLSLRLSSRLFTRNLPT